MQHRSAFFSILLIVVLTLAAAALGATVSGGSDNPWYAALNKPGLTPPDIAFAIVWPVLYILMALGAVLVRLRAGSFNAASAPLGLYFTQLSVNLSWSWLFFGFQQIGLSMLTLSLLWMLILLMISAFGRVSRTAARMQIPYLIWVTFAGYLNLSILWLT